MRHRAVHLASFLLLLASLSAAEGSVLRENGPAFGAHYIGVLLAQHDAAACTEAPLLYSGSDLIALDLPVASRARYRAVWTMRPPAAHTAGLQAVNASGV